MRKRKPVLLNGEALMADGKVLEFDAVDQEELDGKIDAPQTAAVGEVLTVEEIGEDGKPKKWKTAPGVNVTTELTQESTDSQVPSAKAAYDAIAQKLDKAQGVENAGMVLAVANNGNVFPVEPSYLPGLVSYTMAQGLTYDQQALAKKNIGAGTLRNVYYWRANGTPENPSGVLTCAINGDTCICGGKGDSLPDGMQAPVLVIYGSIDRGYRDATAFDGSNATWTFTVNLRDYSYSTPIKKSGIPTPTTAQVGQIVKVKAVDADGKITETETVNIPTIPQPFGGNKMIATEQIGENEFGYTLRPIPTINDFIALGITSAQVGQIIKVKAVDDFGNPHEWEAVDMSTIVSVTYDEETGNLQIGG